MMVFRWKVVFRGWRIGFVVVEFEVFLNVFGVEENLLDLMYWNDIYGVYIVWYFM